MGGKSFEEIFEQTLFRMRWLMAPFYVGLVVAMVVLLITFGKEVADETSKVITLELEENTVVLWLLTLIDMTLAGNLTLMVIFAGYENFVSKLDLEGNPDKPVWMGKVDFSNMKLKLIASIIAISVIHLLKSFMSIEQVDKPNLEWLMMLHGVFLVSGIILAAMDYLGEQGAENEEIEEVEHHEDEHALHGV
ncbi:MAG: TIGR00645 family protein [Alphaproteobacteria bacterium]|nr:TIGR00645 family protein [Alphaproteobacteria bacterium]MBL6938999.1 TIGR00645 family protein [Alphaproteobacteria bacterium]MBL7099591.1 TIGR00645 family protein [Alphaproteobacteria bacterium]